MTNNTLLKKNASIIVIALLAATFLYTIAVILRSARLQLMKTDITSAQVASCPSSELNSFTISVTSPSGAVFDKDCLLDGKQIYTNDTRFKFYQPNGGSLPVGHPYVRTENSSIKNIDYSSADKVNWNINITSSGGANVYVFQRRTMTPTTNLLWMQQSSVQYDKLTPDGLNAANLTPFFLRKNNSGLIGVYDIYKTHTPATGTVTFGPASSDTFHALSMYIVSVVPVGAPGTTTQPTSQPTQPATAQPSATATGSGARPPLPANFATEVARHTTSSDCWTAFWTPALGWHLYNITNYFGLHPKEKGYLDSSGTDKRLMAVCGKDGTDIITKGASASGLSGLGNRKHSGYTSNLTSGDLKALAKFRVAAW